MLEDKLIQKTRKNSSTTDEAKKKLTSLAMAFITFSCVAGGPFGIEVAGRLLSSLCAANCYL